MPTNAQCEKKSVAVEPVSPSAEPHGGEKRLLNSRGQGPLLQFCREAVGACVGDPHADARD